MAPLVNPTTVTALGDGLVAGAVGWVLSGLPSTTHTLARGGSPVGTVGAAGTLLLSGDARPAALLVAGAAAHTVLSFGWASLFALALPDRRPVPAALLAGLAVAALDLGAVGRRYPAIRSLPQAPQVADHLAFGALVGAVISARRKARRAANGG